MIVISMLLVVVGFVTLVLGILEYGAEPLYFIYASIGSCILAGVFLIAGVLRSRPSRKEAPAPAEEAPATGWPPASGPATLLSQDTGVDASDATPPSPRPADQEQDAETWRPTPSTAQPETGSQSRPGVLATPSDEPEPAATEPEAEPGLLATPPDEPEPAEAEPGLLATPPEEPEPAGAEPEAVEAEPEPAATEATEPEPAAGEHTAETQTADAAPHTEEAGKVEATGGEQVPPAPDLSAEKATGGAKKTAKKATGGAKKSTKKATGGAKKTTEKATGGAKKTAKKAAGGGTKKSTKKATGGAKKTASQAASSSTAEAQDETRRIAQALNGLEGCGLAQHRSLAQRFGSYDELLAASIADLADVAGISESLAQRIHERLHG